MLQPVAYSEFRLTSDRFDPMVSNVLNMLGCVGWVPDSVDTEPGVFVAHSVTGELLPRDMWSGNPDTDKFWR